MPIRWRLTVFNALAIGAILLVLGFALFFLLREALLANTESIARNSAQSAARTIGSGDTPSSDDQEQLTINGVFLIVRDQNGKVLTQTISLPSQRNAQDSIWRRALSSGEATSGTADLSSGAPDYVYAVPVKPPNGPARVVEAGKSYQVAQQTIEDVRNVLAIVLGAALLLSIGGAYFLARAALRPVDAVVSSAREMTEGDMTKRLPVANPGDEIGRLATTINGYLDRLAAAFARREEALARQRRFAADASHELRTPLTSISGHARMLDEWALEDDPKRARSSIVSIRREAGRMRNLVEALLALTRGDEDSKLDVGRYDLSTVAGEAVEAAQGATNGKVSIEYEHPKDKLPADFDRERILQLVSILLDNAVKYTPEGGRVTVKTCEKDGRAAVEVADTGIGIEEDSLRLVFERFHRADPSRTEGGAGLGLSIARQISEAHGGTINVKSKVGEGSAFTLLLPTNSEVASSNGRKLRR